MFAKLTKKLNNQIIKNKIIKSRIIRQFTKNSCLQNREKELYFKKVLNMQKKGQRL